MISVKVEFWLWMGKELGEDFHSPSGMRSTLEMDVEEGTTIGELFGRLADRYPPVGEKIYSRERDEFDPHLVVTVNDRIVSPYRIQEKVLNNGDKVTVLPMYMGG